MKKTLIALAALASTAAFAQNVSLYGVVDLGLSSTTTKNAAGTTTGETSGMVSGFQSGSRWGLRGTEDLGGGLKAGFNLESAVGANDGTGNNAFGRRSVLELSGGFGTVGLGRDYTPSFQLVGGTDVTGTDGSTTSDLYPNGVRQDNMIRYTSPSFGGIQAKVGFVGQKTSATAKTSGLDASVIYSGGPLMVGVAVGNSTVDTAAVAAVAQDLPNFVLGSAAVAAAQTKTSWNVLGATYNFGMAKVFANMIASKNKSANTKAAETNLGVAVPLGAAAVMFGVGSDSATSAAGVKSKGQDVVLGADYTLSKRTNVYARYYVDQTPVAAGGKPKTTGGVVGLRHSF